MSSERSVKDLSGPYTGFMERAMGIEPTSELWEAGMRIMRPDEEYRRRKEL